MQQIWAVCKPFRVRNKGTSLYRADLHGCFGFPWLELGPLHASNNISLQLSLLPLSSLAGQTCNFSGNFCTPGCIDIWHFPGTEPTIQPSLGWPPVGLILHFLSLPPMRGCLLWKGQSLQRMCLRRNEQFPALPLNPPSPKQINNKNPVSNVPLQEFLQKTTNA